MPSLLYPICPQSLSFSQLLPEIIDDNGKNNDDSNDNSWSYFLFVEDRWFC